MNVRQIRPAKSLDAQEQFRLFVEEIEKFRDAAAKTEKSITCVADMPRTQGRQFIKRENARARLAVHRRRMFRLLTGGKTA